jgi:hypothetical protein
MGHRTLNIARRAAPWGQSVPLKPASNDSPRVGSVCDSTTTYRSRAARTDHCDPSRYSLRRSVGSCSETTDRRSCGGNQSQQSVSEQMTLSEFGSKPTASDQVACSAREVYSSGHEVVCRFRADPFSAETHFVFSDRPQTK